MSNLTKPPILDNTGQDILSALANIKRNLQQGGGSADPSLHFDWSHQTLPQTGDTNTIYCIPTGDTSDPWDFYAWNDTDQEFVKIDFNMTISIDSALSDTSTNPVQNRVVKGAIDAKADNTQTFTEASTRANIASGETFQVILGKIKKFFTDLKAVAFSGSYNDLSDQPTIPDTSDCMKKGVDRVTAGKSSYETIGIASTADGFAVTASGNYSHASGYYTKALSDMQHVIGKYNEEDANGVYAFIVGGGRLDFDRKNIFTVDWNGDVNAGRSNGLTNDTKLPTGADVISYLNSNLVVGKGNYNLAHCICAGYVTASGNYINFFVPLLIDSAVTSITLTANPANPHDISFYCKSANYSFSDIDTSGFSVISRRKNGLRLELKFKTTKSASELAIVVINSLTLTFA